MRNGLSSVFSSAGGYKKKKSNKPPLEVPEQVTNSENEPFYFIFYLVDLALANPRP